MFGKACAAPLAAFILIAATPPVPAAVALSGGNERTTVASGSSGAGEPAKAERKTCKNFPDTVSRMRTKRLCLTKEQWREFEDAQQ